MKKCCKHKAHDNIPEWWVYWECQCDCHWRHYPSEIIVHPMFDKWLKTP